MSEDRRDVLQVLRYELNFIEQGGYRRNAGTGRGILPFRDTLSCLNYGEPHRPHACHECLLFDFVPEESRTEDVPCLFIPLEAGRTANQILKTGDASELQAAMKTWLQTTIARLEEHPEHSTPVSGN